jgi:outer membrane lipoprotein-sorting protein
MSRRHVSFLVLITLLLLVTVPQVQQAQPPSPYPMADLIAQRIVEKYNNATCVQLAEMKSEKPTGEKAVMEGRVIAALKADPQMRTYFINKIAAPIANKMFECGMIP